MVCLVETLLSSKSVLMSLAAVIHTWNDGALDAQSSAILGESDELLHIIEQLSDDDLRSSLHLPNNNTNKTGSTCATFVLGAFSAVASCAGSGCSASCGYSWLRWHAKQNS